MGISSFGGLRVHANGASSGFKDYSRLRPASQISSAIEVASMLALLRGARYSLRASSPTFAKSDRVVTACRLAEFYDVTAIKSTCYTTRSGSAPATVERGVMIPEAQRNRHSIALDEEELNPTIPEGPRRAVRTCRANVNRPRHVQNQPQPLPVHRRGSDPT